MKNILKYAIIISMTAIALQQSSFVQADEEEYELVKFCPLWPAEYRDGQMGQHLKEVGARYFIPNSFVANIRRNGEFVTHFNFDDGSFFEKAIVRGMAATDQDGCLPYMPVSNGDLISMTYTYSIKRSIGREITFLRDDAETWDSGKPAYQNAFYRIKWQNDQLAHGTKRTVDIKVTLEPHSVGNLMPAASHILTGRGNTLGWKNNEKYLVVTSDNKKLCSNGGSWYNEPGPDSHGYRKVCNGMGIDLETNKPMLQSKVIFAHEMGHGIHYMHDGPTGSYSGDEAAKSPIEECVWIANAHNYHSREWTGGAAKEAFANFIATVAYNDYGSPGEYTIYKPTINTAGQKVTVGTTISLTPGSDGNYMRYTHNICRPPTNFKSLGSSYDWLNFFWEIWNTPNTTARYSVIDINAIWRETTWSDPKETERKIHAWCLPVTTAQSGENGWTCKRYPWSHRDSENWGVYLGFVDDKAAVKHHVGKQWEDLVVTANYKYNIVGKETYNPAKFILFRNAGEKAGVTY